MQTSSVFFIFGTTISGIKLAQIVKIFMHRASTMFYLLGKAVLKLHGRYVLLHFNEITHCYCFGTHPQINGMPRCSCRVLRGSAAIVSIPFLLFQDNTYLGRRLFKKMQPKTVVNVWIVET